MCQGKQGIQLMVQTVVIDARPVCDCPDSTKGNAPCKHLLFVLSVWIFMGNAGSDGYRLKILKVPHESTVWYQKAYTVRIRHCLSLAGSSLAKRAFRSLPRRSNRSMWISGCKRKGPNGLQESDRSGCRGEPRGQRAQ